MAEQYVQVATDGAGKKIRTEEVSVSGQTVEQQVITFADAAGNLLLGSKTSAASLPVVVASDQGAIPVTGTFYQGTQPVSGSVTANAGTNLNTSALALDATLAARTKPSDQQHVIVDTMTPALALDATVATRTKPSDQQHAIIDSGTTAVTQASGANLHANIDNFPATQPVSGTVAVTNFANPLPTTDALQDPAFAAPGATVPALSVLSGGTDGAQVRNVRLATDGRIQLNDGDAIVTELRMIRQGIGLLLSEFSGRGVDLTNLNELEAI